MPVHDRAGINVLKRYILSSAVAVGFFCVLHFIICFVLDQPVAAALWLASGVLWPCAVYFGLRRCARILSFATYLAVAAAVVFVGYAVIWYGDSFLSANECHVDDHTAISVSETLGCNTFHILGFLLLVVLVLLLVALSIEAYLTTQLWEKSQALENADRSDSMMERRSTLSTSEFPVWVCVPPALTAALSAPCRSSLYEDPAVPPCDGVPDPTDSRP